MQFEIDISNSSGHANVDQEQLRTALVHALEVEGVLSAVLSVSVVDNPTIHRLNRQHLKHDYPTDVISFQLEWNSPEHSEPPLLQSHRAVDASIEGEIIVSVEYASSVAAEFGWSVQNELTLYTVHGMLHICGYDDLTSGEKEIMRSRERAVLEGLGIQPNYPVDGKLAEEPPGSPTNDAFHGSAEGPQ